MRYVIGSYVPLTQDGACALSAYFYAWLLRIFQAQFLPFSPSTLGFFFDYFLSFLFQLLDAKLITIPNKIIYR